MTWRIDVAPVIRHTLAVLDPSLREELTQHAADMADDPLPQLRPSSLDDEPRGALVYDYWSGVIRDLRVRLFFDVDFGAKRMVLIGLRTTGGLPEPGP